MWMIHEASQPQAILERLGQRADLWRSWMRSYGADRPWLAKWLYALREPQPQSEDCFTPTPQMHAFRRAATAKALCLAAARSPERLISLRRKEKRSHVSPATICSWQKKYAALKWFDSWLLRGESPTPDVTIASVEEIRYYRELWDYANHYRVAQRQTESSNGDRPVKFSAWIGRQIPDLRLLWWLFGQAAPSDVFVVAPVLQRFRVQRTWRMVCKAADVAESSASLWKAQHPEAFEALKAIAEGRGNPIDPSIIEAVPAEKRRALKDCARACTLTACCERAGLSKEDFHGRLARAEKIGAKAELIAYLESGDRRCGLRGDAGKLFVASELMLAFREAAKTVRSSKRASPVEAHPAFEQWFLDWALPPANNRDGRMALPEVALTNTIAGAVGGERAHPSSPPAAEPEIDWNTLITSPPLSATMLAEKLGQPVEVVERFLRYQRGIRTDCYFEIEGEFRRKGEPRYQYKVQELVAPLQAWLKKRLKKPLESDG
jgi:hypothetical protein